MTEVIFLLAYMTEVINSVPLPELIADLQYNMTEVINSVPLPELIQVW